MCRIPSLKEIDVYTSRLCDKHTDEMINKLKKEMRKITLKELKNMIHIIKNEFRFVNIGKYEYMRFGEDLEFELSNAKYWIYRYLMFFLY